MTDQDRLRADIQPIVADRAVLEEKIYYGELVYVPKKMRPGVYEGLGPSLDWFHDRLGETSAHTLNEQGFALTALVVAKATGLPGKLFLERGRKYKWPYFDRGDEAMIEEQHRLAFEYYRINR